MNNTSPPPPPPHQPEKAEGESGAIKAEPQADDKTTARSDSKEPSQLANDASKKPTPTGNKSDSSDSDFDKIPQKGLISKDQLETALTEQEHHKDKKRMLGAILVDMGFISESALGEILTESSGVRRFDIKNTVLDSQLIRKLPKEVAQRCKAVPVALEDRDILVAVNDIYNILAIDQIRNYFPPHLNMVPVYAAEAEILEIIDQYYGYETSVSGILKEIETGVSEEGSSLDGQKEGYTNPTVRLVDAILIEAIKRNASDIHFEPEEMFLRVRYRIDGKLHQVRSFHKDYWPAIAVRIKIMCGMNIAETRTPQDGRTTYRVMGREVDFRVASHPTIYGENIVLRILDKQKALMPLQKLGFSEQNTQLLFKLLKRPEGVIIVTGPTGSGKTTTLYSIMNYINSPDINIMTLENPVEYQLPMLRQSDVKEDKGMDFVMGIKSLLRQDPDVIFVGEIRDEATASMAMRASMTGHRVFTTLHTNDGISAIPRLVDIGIPPYLLAGALICIMAQRLMRRLCPHCKQEADPNEMERKILGLKPDDPRKIFKPVGCKECLGEGYRGRIACQEIVPIDKGMDELVSTGASRKMMTDYLYDKGFIPMLYDGIGKVLAGVTDVDELIKAVDTTERL